MALAVEDTNQQPRGLGAVPSGPADVGTRTGATDDAVITGPLPALDLAEGHLHISVRRGVTIVEVDGGLDDDLAEIVAPLIESTLADGDAVILDLDQTTLLDRTALEAVCEPLHAARAAVESCIVSGRLSARLVLERWDIPTRFVVFSSVPDALQARAFIESGYGTGWSSADDLRT